jgi:hypothetical protein
VPTAVKRWIESLVASLAAGGLGWFVSKGLVGQAETSELVAYLAGVAPAGCMALGLAGWSFYRTMRDIRMLRVAQMMAANVTEAQVRREVEHKKQTKTLPSILTKPDDPPSAVRG